MNSKSLLFLIVLALGSSCHSYKEYDKESFPTYTWKSGQEIIFRPTIEDVGKTYSMSLGIRHIFGFEASSINVSVKVISPSGKEKSKNYELQIRDKNNEYIASCGGDLCDLETVVDENISFDEPGEFTFVITHGHPGMKIAGIMELGLILDGND